MNATSLGGSSESMVDFLNPTNPNLIPGFPPSPVYHHHHDHSRMRDLTSRKESFRNWPLTHITGNELAEAGFFYLNHADAVECAYCSVQVGRWEVDDDPIAEHRKWSPNCPFLRTRARAPSYETDAIKEQDFEDYDTRVSSFKDWPPAMEQTPSALANAGFYYTGFGDKVICFSCGVGMHAWEKGDVPLKEHAKMSKNCEYLIQQVGLKYIQEVNEEVPEDEETTIENSGHDDSGFDEEEVFEEIEERGKSESDSEMLCKICYDKPRSVLLLPCQHLCACVECSVKLDTCPICREPFESFIKTILK